MTRLSRYSLRMIFGFIACVALAMAAYTPTMRYIRWNEARREFAEWASSTDRTDGKIHTYIDLNRGLDRTSLLASPRATPFLVANAEMRLAPHANGEEIMIFDPFRSPPAPNRFYILPAKEWVDDVDSVIDAWDRWRDREFPNGG